MHGEASNWKSVLSGVSQGSVLGPLLFLIYINDLDNNITSNVLEFADDTKVFRKVNIDSDKPPTAHAHSPPQTPALAQVWAVWSKPLETET